MFKKCPYCDGEMVHPIKMLIIRGQAWHKFTYEGVIEGDNASINPDGVIIERTYCCETCAAQWMESEEFSHGSTFIEQTRLPVDPEYSNRTIWRC